MPSAAASASASASPAPWPPSPKLVIADEPVSALDVSVQAQTLNLLQDLQDEFHLTYLFISHDLSVVEHICDRVAVMYVGKLVEMAETEELYLNPLHPYTEALMSAVPKSDPDHKSDRIVLDGEVADPGNPPTGCYFHPRCRYAIERCKQETPVLEEVKPGHFVSCHRARELKPARRAGLNRLPFQGKVKPKLIMEVRTCPRFTRRFMVVWLHRALLRQWARR